jgi:hypothetical protein
MSYSSSIRNIIILIVSLSLSLWLGVSIVTNQNETVLQIVVASVLLGCIFLGRKIWLLFVFLTALNVPIISGFGTAELGQALFVGFTTIIFLMRRQPLNLKFGEKEFWILLLAAFIVQVYLRNPVGLNIFGSGAVGARPYFVVTLSFISSMILANIVVPVTEIKLSLKLAALASIVGVGLYTLRMGGGSQTGFVRSYNIEDGKDTNRIGTLGQIGHNTARVIVSYLSPLKALLHPIWMLAILSSIVCASASGYRNTVAGVGLLYIVGIAYRGGFFSVLFSIISCVMVIALLSAINVTNPLPPNIQRALSPFPGTWEQRYINDADESTEWRVEMWKEALFTDYWIQNKLLGDGLGLTRWEYEKLTAYLDQVGTGLASMNSGMTQQQEAMMITGGYHSGPVQCVRIIGYFGLMALLIAMIRVAVHAHRQIIRCRNTEWYPIALYTGIPAIILPIFFVFIFGDFGRDVSALFYSYGMVTLLEKNLPLPAYVKKKHIPYVLNKNKSMQSAQLV